MNELFFRASVKGILSCNVKMQSYDLRRTIQLTSLMEELTWVGLSVAKELDLDLLDKEQSQQKKTGMFSGLVKVLKRTTEGFKHKDHVLHEEYKLYYPHTLVFEQAAEEDSGLPTNLAPKNTSITERKEDIEEVYKLVDESDPERSEGAFFYHTIRVEKEIAASEIIRRDSVDET